MVDNIWTKLENKNSLMQKGTQYRNMQAWSRPCALCHKDFTAYTPGNSPADKPPTVTTCEEHRGAPNGISYGWLAWDGANVVPGRKMKSDGTAIGVVDETELNELRAELKGMQELLDEWSAVWKTCHPLLKPYGVTNVSNFAMAVQAMHARLAAYELPAAMATQSAATPQFKPLPAQNGFDPHKALADDLTKPGTEKKMPWVT